MSRRKLSRLAALLGAAVIATLTFAVVARASGFFVFIPAPSDFNFSYSLAAGAVTGCVFPVAGIPNQLIGVNTTSGVRGVGEVSLLTITGAFDEWVGLDSTAGAAITQGFSGVTGTKIVFIDFQHRVQVEVCGIDGFRVHNLTTFTETGNVDLFF